MIILKREDGTVAIMTLAPGADKEEAVRKFKESHPDEFIDHFEYTGKLPTRDFRDAWSFKNNKVVIDSAKASSIHIERVRHARNKLLDGLDKEQLRHLSNPAKMQEIEERKQLLRDLPSKIKNLDWPEILA